MQTEEFVTLISERVPTLKQKSRFSCCLRKLAPRKLTLKLWKRKKVAVEQEFSGHRSFTQDMPSALTLETVKDTRRMPQRVSLHLRNLQTEKFTLTANGSIHQSM